VVNRHGIFPTIFGLLREADPKAEIGCLYEWEGIKYLVDTLSLNYHAQAADYEKFPTALSDMAVKYIKGKTPNLLAVVFDNPDHVGHADVTTRRLIMRSLRNWTAISDRLWKPQKKQAYGTIPLSS